MEGTKTKIQVDRTPGKWGRYQFWLYFFTNKLWKGLKVSIWLPCSGAALQFSIISFDQVCFLAFSILRLNALTNSSITKEKWGSCTAKTAFNCLALCVNEADREVLKFISVTLSTAPSAKHLGTFMHMRKPHCEGAYWAHYRRNQQVISASAK